MKPLSERPNGGRGGNRSIGVLFVYNILLTIILDCIDNSPLFSVTNIPMPRHEANKIRQIKWHGQGYQLYVQQTDEKHEKRHE